MSSLFLGVVGLVLAVLGPHIAEALKPPEPPPPKMADVLAEAGDKLIGRLIDRAKGRKTEPVAEEPAPPAATPWGRYLLIVATTLGLLGALAGTAGWLRHEEHRWAACAMVFGTLAVAWTYIVAALVIALVIVFFLMITRILNP